MIISRKLFSSNEDLNKLLDKAFCEGYEYAQAEFSEKKKEVKKKVKLRDIDSHRGLGRSYFLGGAQGAIGGRLGAEKNARTRTEKRRLIERD